MELRRCCENCRHQTDKPTPEQRVKTYCWGCKLLGQKGVEPDCCFCKRFAWTWNLLALLINKINIRITG